MTKKMKKIIIIALSVVVGLLLVGVGILWANSPGRLKPLRDENGKEIGGALSEKTFVEIGGVRQGFFMRGENPESPVILFLHGGPGSPELPFLLPYEREERLEKYFNVCYWEQRGAGISYCGGGLDDISIDRFVEDTREMTLYLRERFGVDKIYLIGHSWGSYLGAKTIQKYPELYAAYIGIGQVTDQRLSERLAYDHMLAHATETGDKKALRQLGKFNRAAADFPTIGYITSSARTPLMSKYGIGVTHEPISIAKIAKDVLLFPGYTLGEKIDYIRGMAYSTYNVFPQVLDDNLFVSSCRFDVPVYVIQGKYDYQVSCALAREWLEGVEAPTKEFFMFDNSAHSPNIEEPEKFVRVVCEIASK